MEDSEVYSSIDVDYEIANEDAALLKIASFKDLALILINEDTAIKFIFESQVINAKRIVFEKIQIL